MLNIGKTADAYLDALLFDERVLPAKTYDGYGQGDWLGGIAPSSLTALTWSLVNAFRIPQRFFYARSVSQYLIAEAKDVLITEGYGQGDWPEGLW
jgi:hypothetical protein